MNISGGLGLVKILAVVSALGFISTTIGHYTSLSGELEKSRAQVKRLEGRLAGAVMRIERRDNAIDALPTQCRAQAQGWVRTGDIPIRFKPFDQSVIP